MEEDGKEKKNKIKAVFSKKDDMRFISHLDLMRLFQRALRRSGMSVRLTQGFSPHLKISLSRALKLGVESDCEELIVDMSKDVDLMFFKKSLNEKLPAGVRITSCQKA